MTEPWLGVAVTAARLAVGVCRLIVNVGLEVVGR